MNDSFLVAGLLVLAIALAQPVAAEPQQDEISVQVVNGNVFIETDEMVVAINVASASAHFQYPGSGERFTMSLESILCFDMGEDGVFAEDTPVFEAVLSNADWQVGSPVIQDNAGGGMSVTVAMLAVVDAVPPSWLPSAWLPPFVPSPSPVLDWAEVNVTLVISTVDRTHLSESGMEFTVERLHELKVNVSVDQLETLGLGTIGVSISLEVPDDRGEFSVVLEEAGGPVIVTLPGFAPPEGIPDYLLFETTEEGKQLAYVENAGGLREAFFAWAPWAEEIETGLEMPASAHYYATDKGVRLLLSASGASIMFDPSIGLIPETFEYIRDLFRNNLQSFAIGAAIAAGIILVALVAGTYRSEKRVQGLSLEHNRFLRRRK
jgi:hypothetical protein